MTYKVTEIEDRTAHDLIVRATDIGVCPESIDPARASRMARARAASSSTSPRKTPDASSPPSPMPRFFTTTSTSSATTN